MSVGAHITITATLATAVGKLASHHPDHGIRVWYDDNDPEQIWHVVAQDGPGGDYWYRVNDETGSIVAHSTNPPGGAV